MLSKSPTGVRRLAIDSLHFDLMPQIDKAQLASALVAALAQD